MDEYRKRKQERREQYNKTFGVKSIICTACSGSGRYDSTGSPKCGLCNGTGKIKPTTTINQILEN